VTTTPSRPRTPGRSRPTAEGPLPLDDAGAPAQVENGEPVGIPSPRGMARGLVAAFTQPGPMAREALRLGRDGVRILRGTAEIAPSPKDKRFADPAWSLHPAYRRLAQSYLTVAGSLDRLVGEFEAGGLKVYPEILMAPTIVGALFAILFARHEPFDMDAYRAAHIEFVLKALSAKPER